MFHSKETKSLWKVLKFYCHVVTARAVNHLPCSSPPRFVIRILGIEFIRLVPNLPLSKYRRQNLISNCVLLKVTQPYSNEEV